MPDVLGDCGVAVDLAAVKLDIERLGRGGITADSRTEDCIAMRCMFPVCRAGNESGLLSARS